ncbi:hypothetical protein OH76DRAFT_734012 [Lentinus brumalis]|uniref:Uncharacterized protein n=1 Tax=Lentinus brumalis TaxID=2498619 RepID=A0A371DS55_9APHY|nr:hypothetical protein OH76DRAFT_734012 [Polyporus brumalis]
MEGAELGEVIAMTVAGREEEKGKGGVGENGDVGPHPSSILIYRSGPRRPTDCLGLRKHREGDNRSCVGADITCGRGLTCLRRLLTTVTAILCGIGFLSDDMVRPRNRYRRSERDRHPSLVRTLDLRWAHPVQFRSSPELRENTCLPFDPDCIWCVCTLRMRDPDIQCDSLTSSVGSLWRRIERSGAEYISAEELGGMRGRLRNTACRIGECLQTHGRG